MNLKEMQEIKDAEYVKSLGYPVDIWGDDYDETLDCEVEDLEYEMTHLFDYKKKTKEYLKSLY